MTEQDPYRRPDALELTPGRPEPACPPLRPSDPGDATVVLRGVTVRYGAVTAIEGVDLAAHTGTVVALTGPSGAGKSTLLWAIAGAVALDAGEVTIDGAHITNRTAGIRADVVLIPQGNGLAGVLTAAENIAFPLLATGVPARDVPGIVERSLADVGLGESGNHLVEELSGGQQQRVAVARGLAASPTVLLADEPTSELDHVTREQVLDLLRAQADRGAVVIMATHDPEAAALADREVRLDEGRLSIVR
ncbi:ATP-binding cassette domain-containing protein [Lapillicoccus sp.]|uniref:ABC transporter ATP-binding protein n=1 Tax=Lapillicoccus sp. TaxID=1909287 RepID=UPI003266BFB1